MNTTAIPATPDIDVALTPAPLPPPPTAASQERLQSTGEALVFAPGARGFLIERLQRGLGITADGIYGPATAAAVLRLQQRMGISQTGRAGYAEFRAVGLEWAHEFLRCINLVCVFEGTSFGDCNIMDIDGAGLTMGIAGFTSAHGEVQALLAQYYIHFPQELEAHVPRSEADLLLLYLASITSHSAWRSLFFDSRTGRVKPHWVRTFAALGRNPVMQTVQLDTVYNHFWKPALATARRLGFISLQAKCFFLDVAVQNGGWRKQHEKLAQRDPAWKSSNEQTRLATAARAVAASAKAQWQTDVLSRKMTIASGKGVVHGRSINLANYAIIL